METVRCIHGIVAGAFAAVVLLAGIWQIIRAIISIPHVYRMHKAWLASASSGNDYIYNREDVKKCGELAGKVQALEFQVWWELSNQWKPLREERRVTTVKWIKWEWRFPTIEEERRLATIELAEHKMKMEADPAYKDAVKQRKLVDDKYSKLRSESLWH